MTHFPELPQLPDPAAPFRQIAKAMKDIAEGLKAADQAGQEASSAAQEGKAAVDRFMQRPLV
ncbi:MAG: hypothetical protein Q8R28_14945 [Dehalococcoidia bacterium]|nr:hypothetical protein [Dehalococcoidia bacterium]